MKIHSQELKIKDANLLDWCDIMQNIVFVGQLDDN